MALRVSSGLADRNSEALKAGRYWKLLLPEEKQTLVMFSPSCCVEDPFPYFYGDQFVFRMAYQIQWMIEGVLLHRDVTTRHTQR